MSNTEHSWFSPSAAHRAIRCPGSVKASADIPDNSNSDAEKGTQCHQAMEESVVLGMPMWSEDMFTDPASQMDLCQIAWDAVNGFFDDHRPDIIRPESQVNLAAYGYDDIFGTADIIAVSHDKKMLHVIDFKFGYNPVEARNNDQLMIYGLAAAFEYPDVEAVTMVIIQPQDAKDPKTYTMTVKELEQWFHDTLEPAILEAKSDNPSFHPGEIQCKYCPIAKKGCKYQTQQYLTAIEEFNPAEAFQLEDDKLTSLLVMIPAMQDAIKAVEVAAVERLKRGSAALQQKFKLVERQTKRRWKDAGKTEEWLKSKRFKQVDMYKRTVLTPAQAEKLVKTKKFSAAALQDFRDLIEKPSGSITYAPLTDKRKAVEMNEMDAIEGSKVEDIL